MINLMLKALFICLLLFSGSIYGEWFESSGSAGIIRGNIEVAREDAVRQAVKTALSFSGGKISNLEQVSNGVLTETELILNSEGEIKALIITDEQQKNNIFYVTIQVDIQPVANTCVTARYPKSLSVALFKLNKPNHAVDGDIHKINQNISKMVYEQLKLSINTVNVRKYVRLPMRLGEKYNGTQYNSLSDTLKTLSTQTDSQYIVYGEINDLSVEFKSKNSLLYWFIAPPRNFNITIYVYDALQSELILKKHYITAAKWAYNKHEKVDVDSKQFWQKEYGHAIITILNNINIDIEKSIQCLTPIAKIVSVGSNSVQINLGSRNGLTKGKVLTLSYSSNYKDQFGIERKSEHQYEGAMKVIELHKTSAVLRTLNNYPLGNIQINDLALVK
ncbi:MAG: flagellar assembly protein T N-terminal domain-containing protein [Psychromonas sp.]|nr:flagellar assembly protein T N-terminal domain-containing protein [Psychromonas sp.]